MTDTELAEKPAPADGAHRMDGPIKLLSLLLTLFIGWLTFTLQSPVPADGIAGLAPRAMTACVMDKDGYLRGELYGSVRQTLDWSGAGMACDGMPKPDGTGIRLAFREHLDPDTPGLMLVIGIDEPITGYAFDEYRANVTLNDQVGGRFYSTQGQENCWVSMAELVKLTGTLVDSWRAEGLLFCASGLPAAVGPGSVTLGELEFAGRVLLNAD